MILAGGRGERLASLKALVKLGGRTMLELVVSRVFEVVDEVIVVAKEAEVEREARRIGAAFAFDRQEKYGPLVGIATDLRTCLQNTR